jgi:hypothetical protein
MARYHVNSCDCPVGCCDCGEPKKPQIHKGKNLDHLDAVTFDLVKNGICPSCMEDDTTCRCGELE